VSDEKTIDLPHTAGGMIGAVVFIVATLFCAFELVPAWGGLRLGLTVMQVGGISLLTGAFSGALICQQHRLLGAVSGAVAAVGSVAAMTLQLWLMPVTSGKLVGLCALVGCLPGVGLYYLVARILDRPEPPPEARLYALEREAQRLRS
jgi:hypothetical protein